MTSHSVSLRTNSIIASFLQWYFIEAPIFTILPMGKNFLRWGWHFFSIGYFIPRLFAHWHKDITAYGRGFDFRRVLHVLGWNLISRILGAILRIVVLTIGLVVELGIIALTFTFFVLWYAIPGLIVVSFVFGIFMLF